MKKLLALTLSLLMLVSILCTSVSADDDFVTVYTECTHTAYNAGNVIGITLSLRDITLPEDDGISAFSFTLDYDSSMVTPMFSGTADEDELEFDFTSLMTSNPSDSWEGLGKNDVSDGSLDLAFAAKGSTISSMKTVKNDDELVVRIDFKVNSDASTKDILFSFRYVEAYNADFLEYCSLDIPEIRIDYALVPDSISALPENAFPLEQAGISDADSMIYYTHADASLSQLLSDLSVSEAALDNYAIAVVGADGVILYSSPAGEAKGSVVIPAGSYIVAVSSDSEYYSRFASEVEPSNIINVYNVNASGADVSSPVALDNAGFVITDVPDVPDASLRFNGASLTLYSGIDVNFKCSADLFAANGYENPYAVFELNGIETVVDKYTVSGGRYVFDFANLAPHQIGDTIHATLYATYDGVLYASETIDYSIKEYCYNTLANYSSDTYAKLRTLLVDLLNYGAESQLFMSHNTDTLVNNSLNNVQKAWGTSTDRTLETVLKRDYATVVSPTVVWKGAGLNLTDSVEMRFKLDSDSVDGLTVKVKSDIGEWLITSDKLEPSDDGYYYAFFSGFNASQMSLPVYVTVYQGKTAVSDTLRYSIESYAATNQNSDYKNLAALVRAMIKYGDSAKSYIS